MPTFIFEPTKPGIEDTQLLVELYGSLLATAIIEDLRTRKKADRSPWGLNAIWIQLDHDFTLPEGADASGSTCELEIGTVAYNPTYKVVVVACSKVTLYDHEHGEKLYCEPVGKVTADALARLEALGKSFQLESARTARVV